MSSSTEFVPQIFGLDHSFGVARSRAQKSILDTLEFFGLTGGIRGSWKYGDFHLSGDGSFTHSDLDLVLSDATPDQRTSMVSVIQSRLAPQLKLRVSIHAEDSLLCMNLDDSFILNMGEFLSKAARPGINGAGHDYTLAKITLLLLRSYPKERYLQVATRLGSPEAVLAGRVKTGLCNKFSQFDAARLLDLSGHPVVKMFQKTCLDKSTWHEAAMYVRGNIRECTTIADWLQTYLLSKLSITEI